MISATIGHSIRCFKAVQVTLVSNIFLLVYLHDLFIYFSVAIYRHAELGLRCLRLPLRAVLC
jgi:hypothetical protein